jgi:hypothetical protein
MFLFFWCKGGKVNAIAIEEVEQLVFSVNADKRGNESARCRAGDDAWKQTAEVQRPDDTEVTQAEDGAALQYEGRSAEGLSRIMEKVELRL